VFTIGVWYGKKRATPTEKDQSVCSCGHAYSMHDNDNKCQVAVPVKKYNKFGDFAGWDRTHRCACHRYDGIPPAHVYMKDNL
jgi:hypothetical protein